MTATIIAPMVASHQTQPSHCPARSGLDEARCPCKRTFEDCRTPRCPNPSPATGSAGGPTGQHSCCGVPMKLREGRWECDECFGWATAHHRPGADTRPPLPVQPGPPPREHGGPAPAPHPGRPHPTIKFRTRTGR